MEKEIDTLHREIEELKNEVISLQQKIGASSDKTVIPHDTENLLDSDKVLRQSEEKFRLVFQTSPDSINLNGLSDGMYIDVNEGFTELTGYTREDVIGKTSLELNIWHDPIDRECLVKNLMTEGFVKNFESRFRGKNGQVKTALMSARVLELNQEKVILSITRDITERKRAEEALQDSEQRLTLALAAANEGLFDINVQTGDCIVSPEYARMLGYDPAEFHETNAAWRERLHPEEREAVCRIFEDYVAGRRDEYHVEYRQQSKSGDWKWIHSHGKIVSRAADGKPLRMIGTYTDITDRKQAEAALRALSSRHEAILAAVPEIIMEVDCNKVYTWANPAGVEFFGEDVIGKEAAYYFEDEQDTFNAVQPLFNGDEHVFYVESWQRRRDGQKRLLAWWCRTLKDAQGAITGALSTARDITDTKRAEEALRESEARFRALVESAPDAIFVQSAGRFVYLNSAACRLFGASQPEDLLGKDFMDRMAPEYRDNIRERIKFQRETGEPVTLMDQKYLRIDGSQVPVETTAVAIRYQGEPAHMVLIRDVTERKQAEPYREMGREILLILNEQGDLKNSIQRILEILKARAGFDAVGIRLQEGEDFPYFAQHGFSEDFLLMGNTLIERAADGGVCRDKDGNVCLEGACGLVISGKTDPTNPHFTPGGSFWTNDSFPFLDTPPEDDARIHPSNQCIHHGYASVALVPIRNNDRIVGLIQLNDRRKGLFTLSTVELLEGIASHIGAALMRKQVEETLRDSEERHRKIIEASTDAIILRSEKGCVIYANPAALKLFRANHSEDLIGRQYLDLVHPEDRALSAERVRKSIAESWVSPLREHRILALDGQVAHVESTGGLVKHRGETQIFGVFRDITERKQAEQEKQKTETQLRQAQKMEAIGSLAGGIAHDFNNILSVIIGNAEMLEMSDVSSDAKDGLHQIYTASQRAKQLVRQILAFSRQGEHQKLLMSLKPVVRETLDFLRASIPSTIKLQHYIKPDAGAVVADSTQMQQILMNLCTNAAHAMEKKGGVLKIVLDTKTIAEEDVRLDPEVERGDYVRLSVSDTGHGIEPSVLHRIFDPYFTTKGPEKGTGLGLAVVHGIVKSHGGIIRVYSEVGKGTVFHVLLPRADEAPKKDEKAVRLLPSGTERILVVDDEKPLADIYQQMLGMLGYLVEIRTSPVEALEAVRMNPQKYDLVITDMTMPQMTGYNLSKKLMEIRPGLPVILCTGFSDQVNEEKARSVGILAFLLKPVPFHDLANTMRKVLDETHGEKHS